MKPPPRRRRRSRFLLERNTERALGCEPDRLRNASQAHVLIAQQCSCPVNSLTAQPGMRRNPGRLFEGEGEVSGRQATHACDLAKRDVLADPARHILASAPQNGRRNASTTVNFDCVSAVRKASDDLHSQECCRGLRIQKALWCVVLAVRADRLCDLPTQRIIVFPRFDHLHAGQILGLPKSEAHSRRRARS